MGSGGCRGALCSRSGRRRWMGHRCTWVEGDCRSDSGNTEKEKRKMVSEVVSDRPVTCRCLG